MKLIAQLAGAMEGREGTVVLESSGAFALTLSDRLEGALKDAAGLAEKDAIALSALDHFLQSPRVDLLAQVLGLSSSGAVRLVDRLEEAGLARRATADGGRVTSLALTPAGRRRAEAFTRARAALMPAAVRRATARCTRPPRRGTASHGRC